MFKPSFLFSYFWSQIFSVSCRAWIRIRVGFLNLGQQWNVWHIKFKIQKRGIPNYLENLFNVILNIFHGSGPRNPDPYPETWSSSLRLSSIGIETIFLHQIWIRFSKFRIQLKSDHLLLKNIRFFYLKKNYRLFFRYDLILIKVQ